MTTSATYLAQVMRERGLTDVEVSRLSGVSVFYVGQIRRNSTLGTKPALTKIAVALGINDIRAERLQDIVIVEARDVAASRSAT